MAKPVVRTREEYDKFVAELRVLRVAGWKEFLVHMQVSTDVLECAAFRRYQDRMRNEMVWDFFAGSKVAP